MGLQRVRDTFSVDAGITSDVKKEETSSNAAHLRLFESERRMRARAEQLQYLSSALTAALTGAAVAAVIVDRVRDALGASAAGVFELAPDGADFVLLAGIGMSEQIMRGYLRIPVTRPLPIRDVALSRAPVFLPNVDAWKAQYAEGPLSASGTPPQPDGSWAALPLLVEQRFLGVLTMTFPLAREFPADDRAHMQAFGDQCAQGLDRARAYEAESAARARAERSTARLAALQAAATALGATITPQEVADATMLSALPSLGANRGSVALMSADGNALELASTLGYSAADVVRYRRIVLSERFPLADAARDRKSIFLSSERERRERYPELSALIESNGSGAMAAVPLMRVGEVIGVLGVNWDDSREFDAEDQTFLEALAQQCAQALDRASLFEGERRARARGEMILSSIQDGFVAFDHDFRFTYVNQRAEQILQRPAAELLGRSATEIFPQYLNSPFARIMREALSTRRARMVEGFVAPVGAWTEARIYPTDDGASVFIQDVTERRRNEETNRILAVASAILGEATGAAETSSAIVHSAIPDFADWQILEVANDAAVLHRAALGGADTRQVARSAEFEAQFSPDFWGPLCVPTVFASGLPRLVEHVTREGLLALMRGKQDAEAHADAILALDIGSALCVPLVARGRTIGVLTFLSASEHRRYSDADLPLARELASRAASALEKAKSLEAERAARAEAEAARRDAEEANRAKMDFLTAMSHELRTPLNAIGGYAEILALGLRGPINDEQRQDLTRIEGNQRHLLGLINDVLNFAKLDAGKVEYTIGEVELRSAMSTVAALVAPQLETKNLRFAHPTHGDVVLVRADAEKVRQILLNVLSNAVKYTPSGGTIEVACVQSDGRGMLSVRDSGVGIDASKLERIFEPFVQLGRTLSSRTEGTGLGLAISRDLARAMAGELTAESEVGVGSTFTLSLPGI
ncbi:MAG: GAF domain-containing protein [Gemmatimonadaceae bacterium]